MTSPAVVIKENVAVETVNNELIVTHSNVETRSTKTTIPFVKKQHPGMCRPRQVIGIEQTHLHPPLCHLVFVFIVMVFCRGATLRWA